MTVPAAFSIRAFEVSADFAPSGQTFSGGVARWDGLETSDELVARADRALYEAKHAGRDCVMRAPDAPRLSRLPSQNHA